MKKLFKPFALLIALVMMTACFSLFVAAEGEPTASVAYGTPTIDGVMDDVWNTTTKVDHTFAAFDCNNVADLMVHQVTASIRFLWDENYLYLLFDVNDPHVGDLEQEQAAASNSGLWQSNAVQMHFDWGHEGHSTNAGGSYDGNDVLVSVGVHGTVMYHTAAFNGGIANSKSVVTETGYILEIAIEYDKFASLYDFTPAAGEEIGFGCFVQNAPAAYSWYRESYCGWGVSNLLQDWPNQMGILTLAEKPATPPAQPENPETPDDPTSPETGDAGIAVAAVALLSAAVVIASKKRR